MWWIIGIIALSILLFLWIVVRAAARSVDDECVIPDHTPVVVREIRGVKLIVEPK